jgi:hypothetical protein
LISSALSSLQRARVLPRRADYVPDTGHNRAVKLTIR